MTVIYVVLGNWCDDTWVEAICSTRQNAEFAMREGKPVNVNNPTSTGFHIEEWELDKLPNQQNQP